MKLVITNRHFEGYIMTTFLVLFVSIARERSFLLFQLTPPALPPGQENTTATS